MTSQGRYKAPFIRLYPSDYLLDTGLFTATEHGAYLMLMFAAWHSEDCALPDDDDYLRAVSRCDVETWQRIRDKLLSLPFFSLNRDGRFQQKRLYAEWKYAHRKHSQHVRGGKSTQKNRDKRDNTKNPDKSNISQAMLEDSASISRQNQNQNKTQESETEESLSNNGVSNNIVREGIIEVLTYWKQAIEKPNWSNTEKRKKKIRTALTSWNLTPEQCKEVINGALADPTLNGENERGPFLDIENIFRNQERAERLRDRYVNNNGNDTPTPTHKRKTGRQGTLDITGATIENLRSKRDHGA